MKPPIKPEHAAFASVILEETSSARTWYAETNDDNGTIASAKILCAVRLARHYASIHKVGQAFMTSCGIF